MNELIKHMGFESVTIFVAFVLMAVIMIVLIALVIVLLVNNHKLNQRVGKFFTGKDGATLEADIVQILEDNKVVLAQEDKNNREMKILRKYCEDSFQKMGLVKYDAFSQMGGQLSFSLCLLDKNNNGFILNSVHSAEGCYCYTKEIEKGVSSLDLGEEEKEALSIALSGK